MTAQCAHDFFEFNTQRVTVPWTARCLARVKRSQMPIATYSRSRRDRAAHRHGGVRKWSRGQVEARLTDIPPVNAPATFYHTA